MGSTQPSTSGQGLTAWVLDLLHISMAIRKAIRLSVLEALQERCRLRIGIIRSGSTHQPRSLLLEDVPSERVVIVDGER